jgi:hypothetical protein
MCSDSESDNDIKDIVFRKINNEFIYGLYGDFKVVMMMKNGYINATKLCQLTTNNKHDSDYDDNNDQDDDDQYDKKKRQSVILIGLKHNMHKK